MVATARVGVACCRRSGDADPSDLYPDGDPGPLQAGEGVVDRPWERMVWSGLTTPSAEQSAMAKLTMAVVSQRLGGHLRTPELPSSTGSPANPSSSRSN